MKSSLDEIKEIEPLETQIAKTIQQEFKDLQIAGARYGFNGEKDDYMYKFKDFTAINMVNSLIKRNRKKISVLDIGCGKGELLKKLNTDFPSQVETYGVNAFDYKIFDYKIDNDKYGIVVADAHDLSKIPKFKDINFDLIVTRLTFIHLIHPLQALEQAYSKLAIGGYLICDRLVFYPFDVSKHFFLMTYLKAQGYKLATLFMDYLGFSRGPMDILRNGLFIIQKTHDMPTLKFPIIPVGFKHLKRVTYAITAEFKEPVSFPTEDLIKSVYNNLKDILKADTFALTLEKIAPSLSLIISAFKPLFRFPAHNVIGVLDYCYKPSRLTAQILHGINDEIHDDYCLAHFLEQESSFKEKLRERNFEDIITCIFALGVRDFDFHKQFLIFEKQLSLMDFPLKPCINQTIFNFFQQTIFQQTTISQAVFKSIPSVGDQSSVKKSTELSDGFFKNTSQSGSGQTDSTGCDFLNSP